MEARIEDLLVFIAVCLFSALETAILVFFVNARIILNNQSTLKLSTRLEQYMKFLKFLPKEEYFVH